MTDSPYEMMKPTVSLVEIKISQSAICVVYFREIEHKKSIRLEVSSFRSQTVFVF